MGYDIKSIKKEFASKGIFYTPPELAEFLKSFVDIDTDEVYDPTCGHGSLLSVFGDEVKKYGQDINPVAIEYIKENFPHFHVELGDTIQEDKFSEKKFKVILANPPFSVKYEPNEEMLLDKRFKDCGILSPASKADYMFNLHILHKLKENGIAVVMNFPGILYRKNKEGEIRKWLIENNYIDTIVHIAGKKFEDTNVATCLIIYRKNKVTTDIKFVDSEFNLERMVSLEEIRENNYNLSISTYVQKEEQKEKINIDDVNEEVNRCFLIHLEETLKVNLFLVQSLEAKIDYEMFLNKIGGLVRKYRSKFKNREKEEIPKQWEEQLLLFNK